MTERARWSHSKLAKLWRCGEAYRRDEEEREYAPPTSAMVRGTAVHHVAAVSHGQQVEGKAKHPDWPKSMVLRESLPGENEAADIAATKFDQERRASGIVPATDDEVAGEPPAKIIGADKDSAVRMARYFVTRVAPFVDPIAVEQKIVIEPADAPIRVSGIFDLVTNERPLTPGGPPRRGVRDYKTGRRAPDAREADDSGQLTMYALLDSLGTGKIADVFALDWVVEDSRRFSGAPYLVSLETTRTQEDLDVMIARLNNAIEGVKAGIFIANGIGTWYCSPKFCRYWTSCKFVSHARPRPR